MELRICDAVTLLDDAVALAAYCQALVKRYSEEVEAGREIPTYHRMLTTENKWLAARYGLEAPVIDLAPADGTACPSPSSSGASLRDIEPHARELGSERELEGIRAHPRPGQRRGLPAPHLQREPGHRRGGARDRTARRKSFRQQQARPRGTSHAHSSVWRTPCGISLV